jgi:hypothetical protein
MKRELPKKAAPFYCSSYMSRGASRPGRPFPMWRYRHEGFRINTRFLPFTQHHKPSLVRVIVVLLPPRLQHHPVSRRDDLGVHHARLGAAQAGVGPIDRFHRDQLDLVNRHAQPLSQVLFGQPHHLLRPRWRRHLCSSHCRLGRRPCRPCRGCRCRGSWCRQSPFHPARLRAARLRRGRCHLRCPRRLRAARLRRGRYRLRYPGRRFPATTGTPQAYQEEQHPRYQPMMFHACSPRSYSSSRFIIQTLPPSEKFSPS